MNKQTVKTPLGVCHAHGAPINMVRMTKNGQIVRTCEQCEPPRNRFIFWKGGRK
jgi:hypothetical protein